MNAEPTSTLLVLGSGFSAGAGLPTVGAITDQLTVQLNRHAEDGSVEPLMRVTHLLHEQRALSRASVQLLTEGASYEDLLAAIDGCICVDSSFCTHFADAGPHAERLNIGLSALGFEVANERRELHRLRSYVAAHAAELLHPYRTCWGTQSECDCGDSSWIADQWLTPVIESEGVVEIVTTNHDRVIEHVCDARHLTWSTGSHNDRRGPLLAATTHELEQRMSDAAVQVRVTHLHGAVCWVRNHSTPEPRIRDEHAFTARELHIEMARDAVGTGSTLVTGASKHDHILRVPEITALWNRAEHITSRATHIIVCGYGARDVHVNHLLARITPTTHVTIIDRDPEPVRAHLAVANSAFISASTVEITSASQFDLTSLR